MTKASIIHGLIRSPMALNPAISRRRGTNVCLPIGPLNGHDANIPVGIEICVIIVVFLLVVAKCVGISPLLYYPSLP